MGRSSEVSRVSGVNIPALEFFAEEDFLGGSTPFYTQLQLTGTSPEFVSRAGFRPVVKFHIQGRDCPSLLNSRVGEPF